MLQSFPQGLFQTTLRWRFVNCGFCMAYAGCSGCVGSGKVSAGTSKCRSHRGDQSQGSKVGKQQREQRTWTYSRVHWESGYWAEAPGLSSPCVPSNIGTKIFPHGDRSLQMGEMFPNIYPTEDLHSEYVRNSSLTGN